MKPVAYFLCALALILICISPWLIMSFYEKLPEKPYFQGILSLWHISRWRTGGSSSAAFLEKRIAQFEGNNPHVFIELKSLTADEALQALQNGEKPDLISYPYGIDLPLELAALPHTDTLFSGLPDTAYPYMCGGYCILLNTDLMTENSIDPAVNDGIRPEALLEAAKLGVAFDAEAGYTSLPALALHTYPPASRPSVSTWGEPEPPDAALNIQGNWENGFAAFCEGNTAVLIASHRQLFEATDDMTQSSVPGFTACAIGPYTDMVQMIGVAKQEDELRMDTCKSFSSFMLTSNVQKKLEALGVFPVIGGLEIYAESDIHQAIYERLSQGAALPEPGSKDTLDTFAKEAFAGDERALNKLRGALRGKQD